MIARSESSLTTPPNGWRWAPNRWRVHCSLLLAASLVWVSGCGGSHGEPEAIASEPEVALVNRDEQNRGARSGERSEMPNEIVDLGVDASGLPLRAVQVVSGEEFSCALVHTGRVKCWSQDDELGVTVSDIGVDGRAIQLSAGRSHACALFEGGAIRCWGDNSRGQLGLGDRLPRALAAPGHGDSLDAADLGAHRYAVRVRASDSQTCALLDNGQFKCWGFGGHLALPNS